MKIFNQNIKKQHIFLIVIIAVVLLLLALISAAIFFVYYLSGFGKCNFGKVLYFKDTKSEGCYDYGTIVDVFPDQTRMLKITEAPWTGWSRQQPEKTVQNLILDNTIHSYNLEFTKSDTYKLEIVSYSNDSIKLKVSGLDLKLGSMGGTNGTNFNQCGLQEFELKIGESAQLDTCTLDGGVKWTIEYL